MRNKRVFDITLFKKTRGREFYFSTSFTTLRCVFYPFDEGRYAPAPPPWSPPPTTKLLVAEDVSLASFKDAFCGVQETREKTTAKTIISFFIV